MELSNQDSALPERAAVTDEQRAAVVGQILRGELTPQEACEREGLSELELKRWVRAYTRAARQAIDDQVAAALAAHGLEVDERPTTEFSGSLGSVGLPELIQTIQHGRKDAHIRIDHDGEQSWLWCMEGDVVDASSAQLTGSAAIYRILSIQRGQLHADFSPVQRSRTVHASTPALMLEAAKRADECAEIRSRLGDTLNIYVPSASAPSELLIEHDQAAVLRAFDGQRTIDDVVHQSELPDLETLGLIERLLEQEWLVLEPFKSKRPSQRITTRATSSIVDASFRPLAASLASRLSLRHPRQRLWVSAFAGVAVVGVAFAIGFYSAQHEVTSAANAATAAAPACGESLAPIPGGACIDRAEVSAGDYQVCVRSGACEPVQREFAASPAEGSARLPEGAVIDAVAPAAPGTVPAGAAASAADIARAAGDVPAAPGPVATGSTVAASVTLGAPAPPALGPPSAAATGATAGTASPPSPGATLPPTASTSPAGSPASGEAAALADDASEHCNAGLPGREQHAINCVTFQQARRYCEWRGGRLPLREEWELAASPERASLGIADLIGGLSEWTIEPATGTTEAARERAVVLGSGLAPGAGTPRGLTRLYMNANAQGRSVGFRCVVRADTPPALAANSGRASR